MAKKEKSDEMIVVDAERYRRVKKALTERKAGDPAPPPGLDEKESTRELVVVDVGRYKKVKKALAVSEERYRHLFENVPIGIYRTTPDGRIIDANPALVKMLGYGSFAELAKRNLEQNGFEPGYDRCSFILLLEREGEIKGLEAGWKKKDGTLIQVRENAKLVRNDDGQVFFEGTVEDITQRKLAEEAQRRHTRQIEILNTIITKGNLAESMAEMLEKTLESVVEPLDFDTAGIYMYDAEAGKVALKARRGAPSQFYLLDDYMMIENMPFSQVLLRGQPVFVDHLRDALPDLAAKWGWRMACVIPMVSKGRIIGALGLASCRRDDFTPEEKNILELIGMEAGTLLSKLQTETALRESEKYYRTLIDTSPDIIAVMDLEARLLTVNQQFLKAGGYFYDEVIGACTYDFVAGFDRDLLARRTEQFIASRKISGSEYIFRMKDGRTVPLDVSAGFLYDDAGNPSGIIAIGRDVSERNRAEAALRDSEEKFRSIAEQTSDLIAITNGEGVITYASPSALSLFQYTPEEMCGRNFIEFLDESSVPSALAAFRADQQPGRRSIGLELTIRRKDGSVFAGELNGSSFHYGDRNGSLVVIRDISERKRAELAIEEKNKILATLNEISLELASLPPAADINEYIVNKLMSISRAVFVGITHYNKDTRQLEFAKANAASKVLHEATRILGRNVESIKYDISEAMYKEITGEVVGYRSTLHEASFGSISRKAGAILQRLFNIDHFIGMALVVENELIGTAILAMSHGTPDVSGELLRSFSHIASVSLRRRQAECRLAASEEKFKKLFYISPDSIILSRLLDDRIVSVNTGFTKVMGYLESEVVGKTTMEINLYENPEESRKIFAALRTKGVAENIECWFVNKSGIKVLGLVSDAIIEINDEKFVMSTIRDITERKRAEEELRFLGSITENTTDAIIVTDADFRITYINKVCERFFGYTLEDLRGKTPGILNAERQAEEIQKRIYETVAAGETYLGESLNRRKDGSSFYCEYKVMPLGGRDGAIRAYFSVHRDVSERRRAEADLRESEETFRRTFAAIPSPAYMWVDQEDGRITLSQFNRAAEVITQGKIRDFLGIDVDLLYADRPELATKIKVTMRGGKSLSEEIQYTFQSTGETKWLVVDYVHTSPGHVMVITRDVSERKQAEAKLLAYQEQLRALTSELTLVEERERRRLAADLHDQIGQNLALCKLKVVALERGKFTERAKSELSAVRRLLECSIQDARSLIFDLSPPVLYELGFEAALEWLAEWIGEQYHVPVDFESHAAGGSLEIDRQVILFQVVRELLVNMGKHAQAGRAKVILALEGALFRIQVNDDGRGFDASRVFDPRKSQGSYGFFSMRERLNYLGGSIDVRSKPGMGSQITLTVPRESPAPKNSGKEGS